MVVDLDEKFSLVVVGQVLGISKQAVSDLVNKMRFTGSTNGELIESISKRYREQAAGRGGDAQEDYVRIKIRRELAAAKKDELANHKEVFNLVPMDAIEPLMNNWATVARSEVLNAVEKMVAGIEGKFKIEVDRDLIDGPVDDAFRAIGDYPTRAAAVRAAGGNAADIGSGPAAGGAKLASSGERSDAGVAAR